MEPALEATSTRYELIHTLAKGSQSRVWAARDTRGERDVAVKEFRLAGSDAFKRLELFQRGARVLSSLEHWGVPRAIAFDGQGHLVLELLRGGTLRARVGEQQVRRGPEEVAEFLEQLLEVAVYLHSRVPSVVHRDIHPDNIMFREGGDDWRPVLIDFDTVAAPEKGPDGTTIVCTPGYTAPEQLAGHVTPEADLYSIGMTVLYLVTHRDPHQLARRRGRWQVRRALSSLDPVTARVLTRLIEPSLEDRYPSAAQALVELKRRRRGQELASELAPPQVQSLVPRPSRLSRTMGPMLLLVLSGIVAGILWGFYEQEVATLAGRALRWLLE